MEIIFGIALLLGVAGAIVHARNKKRRANLFAKYGDAAIVERIMRKQIWQMMTVEQLIDSWGRPAGIAQKVYKTKVVEIFKYNQTGKNRFRSRVRVENGFILGWDQK